MESSKSPDKSKETDELYQNQDYRINNNLPIRDDLEHSKEMLPAEGSPDLLSNDLLSDSKSGNNNGLGDLEIAEEKVIKPGLVLVKTEQEAIIVHTNEPINQSNMTPKELINNLKNDPNQKDSIYINMADIEEQYLKGNLLGDNEEISHDEKTMKKLYTEVSLKHPCKIKNGEPVKYPVCVNTGWFCGCNKCKKSKLTELGIGMIVYFKFLKALVLSFFVISLFNFPLLVSYHKNHKDEKVKDYMDALYKTTIGNIGSSLYHCQKLSISDLSNTVNLNLQCNTLIVAKVTTFSISKTEDDEKENKLNCFGSMTKEMLSLDTQKCDMSTAANEIIKEQCQNQNTCSFSLDLSQQNCTLPFSEAQYIFFTYACYEDNVPLPFMSSTMKRSNFGFIVAIIDIISILIVLITLIVVKKYMNKNLEEFIKSRTFIRDFTLHLTDIKIPKENIKKEFNDLLTHFASVAKVDDEQLDIFSFEPISLKHHQQYEDYHTEIQKNFEPRNFFIYDMVYPILTSEKLSAIQRYNELQEEISELNKEIEKLSNNSTTGNIEQKYNIEPKYGIIGNTSGQKEKPKEPDNENGPVIYKQPDAVPEKGDEIVKNVDTERNNEKSKKEIQKEAKITKLKNKIEKLTKEMEEKKVHIKEKSDIEEVKEIYITFRNYNIARYYAELYRKTKCQRCNIICCCQGNKIKHLYYKNKWLNLNFAQDEPSNIKWENITYSPCKKCLRSTLAMIFAIIIILITLLIILFCKHYESELNKEFNTSINCNYVNTENVQEVIAEYSDTLLDSKEKILTYCFCNKKLTTETISLSSYTFPGTQITPCKNFLSSYLKYTAISTAIVVAVPVINAVVVIILKLLTSFEKNKTLSTDMSANMWKMFIVQFINSCLLLIIVNMKIDNIQDAIPNFPFFAGNFGDLDPEWYSNVGGTLLFSMILNIITPHLASLFFMYLTLCFRCCDSGCEKGKITKKKTRKEYFELYTGPEFDMDARYASILTYLYIVLILAPGMPLLYICFFLYILLTIIIDKIMILRYYKNPPRYDLKIAKIFSNFLYFAIVLHFLFAVWTYGQPDLLVNILTHEEETKSVWGRIKKRVCLKHNLIIDVVFIILVIVTIIKFLFMNGIFDCCCKKKNVVIDKIVNTNAEIGLAVPLRELYQNYQVKQIEYFQSLKVEDDSIVTYQQNLRFCLNYVKNFLIYKITKDCGKNGEDFRVNFDGKIAKEQDILDKKCKKIIKGDTSYNLAFIPEFESVAYFEYLKNM